MDLLNRFEFDAELKQTGVYGGTAGIVKSIRVGEIDYSLTLPEAYSLVLLRSPDIKWKQVVHNGITYNAYLLMYTKGVPEGGIWWWKDSGDIPFNATASQISAAFASDDLLSTALVKGGPLHEAPIFLLLPVGPYDLLEYHRYIRYALTPAGGLYAHRDGTRIATGDCENSDPVALVHNTDELAAAFTTSPPEGRMLKCGYQYRGDASNSTFKVFINIETDAKGLTGTFKVRGKIDLWRWFLDPVTTPRAAAWLTVNWETAQIPYDAFPETIFIAIADAIDLALEYEAVDRDSVNLQGTGITVNEVKISFDLVGTQKQLSPWPPFTTTYSILARKDQTSFSDSVNFTPAHYTNFTVNWSASSTGNYAARSSAIVQAINAVTPYVTAVAAVPPWTMASDPSDPFVTYNISLTGTDALHATATPLHPARIYPRTAYEFSVDTRFLLNPSVRVFTPKLELVRRVTTIQAVLDICVIDEKYKVCAIADSVQQKTYLSTPTATDATVSYFGTHPTGGVTDYKAMGMLFCETNEAAYFEPGAGWLFPPPPSTDDPNSTSSADIIPTNNPFDLVHSRQFTSNANAGTQSGIVGLSPTVAYPPADKFYAGDYKDIVRYRLLGYTRGVIQPDDLYANAEQKMYPYGNGMTPGGWRGSKFKYIPELDGSQPHNNPPPTGAPPAPAAYVPSSTDDCWDHVQHAVYGIIVPNYTVMDLTVLSDSISRELLVPYGQLACELRTYDKSWNQLDAESMYVPVSGIASASSTGLLRLANSPNTYSSYPALAHGQNFLFPWSDDTVSYWSTSSKFTRRGAGGLENETSTSHKGKLHQVDDHLYKLKEILDPMQLVQFQHYAVEKYDRNLVLIATTALTWNSKALFPWAFTVDAFGVLYVLADLYTHSGIVGGQEYYPLTLFRFDDMTATSLVQTTKLQTFTYKRGTVEDASGYRNAAKTCNAIFRMYVREGRVVIEGPEIRWEAGNGYA